MKKAFFSILFSLCILQGFSQDVIQLNNPSFEDAPRHGKAPSGWYDCGFSNESPPDVHGDNTSFFLVEYYPTHGKTLLGLVVRDNDTWEMVGQMLKSPIKKDNAYTFSIDLARSERYVSVSRTTEQQVNYTSPVKLRIWGGNGHCRKNQLLAETPLVINANWLTYDFAFTPDEDYDFILLEAFYKTPTKFPYNGNLLLDNASPIITANHLNVDSLRQLAPKIDSTVDSAIRKRKRKEENIDINIVDDDFVHEPIKWAEAGSFTDDIRDWLNKMIIVLGNELTEDSEKLLVNILEDLEYSREFSQMVIGIMGKKNRQKRLKNIINSLLLENEIDESLIRFEKVEIGDSEEIWVGKNKYYRIRLE